MVDPVVALANDTVTALVKEPPPGLITGAATAEGEGEELVVFGRSTKAPKSGAV
jgi:hypothetical protein